MRHRKIDRFLTLLVCLVLILESGFTSLPRSVASGAEEADDGYTPTGIPADLLPDQLPLQNINLRYTPPGHEEMGRRIQRSLSASRAESAPSATVAYASTPEIETLAAGLENNPLRLYEYVRNHVDFIPTWGLCKSPRETLLSGCGNPFDQAALLVSLLQAAGYSTRYVFGTIQISESQAMNWTGVTQSDVVAYAFANGGISATDAGSYLTIEHVWVEVNADGSWYPLDPAFKSYDYRSGLDLATILNYNQTDFLNAAGGSVSSDYARNLNDAGIRNRLASYSNALLTYLEANSPFAYIEDVIGGREIIPETLNALPGTLPYTVISTHGAASDFPADMKYLLRIQLAGIDYQLPLADVAGERVTIFYQGTTYTDRTKIAQAGGIYNVYPAYEVDMTPHLRVNGVLVASGEGRPLGTGEAIVVTVITPIPDNAGGNKSYEFTQQVTTGAWYALPIRVQDVSSATLNRHYGLLQESINNESLEPDAEALLGQAMYVVGLSYFNQTDLIGRLGAQLGGIVEIPFFSVMLMSQDISPEWDYVADSVEVVRVRRGACTIDVQMAMNSLVSASGDESMEIAYMLNNGIKGSAAEHATIEQLQNVPSISTIRALVLANAEGQKNYSLSGLSQLNKLDYHQTILLMLSDYLAAGYRILIPMSGVTQQAWHGMGWIAYDPTSGSAGYMISGALGGGQTGTTKSVDPIAIVSRGTPGDTGISQAAIPTHILDPIDVQSGAFKQQERGLTLDEEFSFFAAYSSARSRIKGPLGYGWVHNYGFDLRTGSDWGRALGTGSAADAAGAIVASFLCLDILNATPGTLPFQRLLVSAIAADWALALFTDNSVLVQGPWGTAQFLKLTDGGYAPPAGFDRTLIHQENSSYILKAKDGSQVRFNGQGQATGLADANGNQTRLSYDTLKRLRRVAGPTGRGFYFLYNDERLIQATDSAGRSLRYTYDSQGNLTGYTNARGGVTVYSYDSQHHLITLTDPAGTVVATNTYDPLGQVKQQRNGRGMTAYLMYGCDRTTLLDASGYRTTYFFDARRRLTGVQDDLDYHTAATYDAHNNLLNYTDTNGHALTFTYDAQANLTGITNVSGTIMLEYDDEDNAIQMTDARGNATHFTYDSEHNLTQITDAQNHTTAMAYNAKGRLITLTDARGYQTHYTYNPHGHLIGVVGPMGDETQMYYDSAGRLINLTDAQGQTTCLAYDASDNLTVVTDTLGYATDYIYDDNDHLIKVTDPRGAATRFGYDAQFNLVVVTDTLGYATRYIYDANDNLVSITDAKGHTTFQQRDALGRTTVITDALSRVTYLSYDGEGNLSTLHKSDGYVITYTYDALNRLAGIAYPDDGAVAYGYDVAGNLTSAGYDEWQARYQYDALNRLSRVTYPAPNRVVAYAYDPLGYTQAITATEGSGVLYQARYVYNKAGRPTQLIDGVGGETITLGYDLLGNLTSVSYANGATTGYTYDTEGRMSGVQTSTSLDGVIDRLTYRYDAGDNPIIVTDTMRTDSGLSTYTRIYTYDLAGRVTGESYPGYSGTYSYDAVGNLTGVSTVSGTMAYQYDNANQLLSAGDATYSYDMNGNRSAQINGTDVYTYRYDYEDRLIGWEGPSGAWQFGYDAIGRRIYINSPDAEQRFLYDGWDIILEDWAPDLEDPWQAAFMLVDGRLLARRGGPGNVSFHADALGNIRHLVDEAGNATDAYRYHAYGLPVLADGSDVNPYRFVGQWGVRAEANESSWDWMRYRIYDAATGSFLTQDPLPGTLEQPYTLSPYQYAGANPLRSIDPYGLRKVRLTGARAMISAPQPASPSPINALQNAPTDAKRRLEQTKPESQLPSSTLPDPTRSGQGARPDLADKRPPYDSGN